MNPADLLNRMNELNEKPTYYEHIAKAALWIISAVLFGIVVVGTRRAVLAYQYQPEVVANVVSAAQALGAVCLCVLGYRGGRRGRK